MRTSRRIHDQLSGIAVNTTRVARGVDVMELDIFYDYNCPFVYRATKLLESVATSGERPLKVRWRFFSLTQVNHRSDEHVAADAAEDVEIESHHKLQTPRTRLQRNSRLQAPIFTAGACRIWQLAPGTFLVIGAWSLEFSQNC